MKKFITKKYIIGAMVVVVVIIGFVVVGGGEEGQMVRVTRKDVVQEVVVTGKTKAESQVELGFDTSGRVAHSYFFLGDRVNAGSVIATLDINSDLATLAKERALLAEDELNLTKENEKIEGNLREAFSVADNAVRNKTDQFFKTPRTKPFFEVKFSDGNFVHYFNVPTDVSVDLANKRLLVEGVLVKWQIEIEKINIENAEKFVPTTIERMNTISDFLDKVAYAVNSFTPAEFTYEATIVGYKTAIDLARSTVATARTNLIDVSSAGMLKINQRQASIESLLATINKSRIVAPFAGTITRQEAKVGEVATIGESLITLISEDRMYVEANVSEVNIGKVKVADKVKIEFDAYEGESFSGSITFIDPGESVVDKVVNYKIRVELDENLDKNLNKKIKSGLTANVKIVTASSTSVLSIPVYATTKEENKIFVNKLVDGKPLKTEVQIGLSGSDGSLEIISGLSEGDTIEFAK